MIALFLALALAGTPAEEAEASRLSDEVVRLAQKGAWSGVERSYASLRKLPVELGAQVHALGAEAALHAGDVGSALARWELAYDVEANEAFVERYTSLRNAHAEVYLEGEGASLVPVQTPFSPQAQAAVGFAARLVAEEGRFHGWLPAGDYVFGGRMVELTAGQRVRVILQPMRNRRRLGDVLGIAPTPVE